MIPSVGAGALTGPQAAKGRPYGAEDTMGAGFLSYPSTNIRMGMVTTHPMVDNVAPMAA